MSTNHEDRKPEIIEQPPNDDRDFESLAIPNERIILKPDSENLPHEHDLPTGIERQQEYTITQCLTCDDWFELRNHDGYGLSWFPVSLFNFRARERIKRAGYTP